MHDFAGANRRDDLPAVRAPGLTWGTACVEAGAQNVRDDGRLVLVLDANEKEPRILSAALTHSSSVLVMIGLGFFASFGGTGSFFQTEGSLGACSGS